MADEAAPVVAFKKRGARPKGNIRKRPAAAPVEAAAAAASDNTSSSDDDDDDDGPRVKRRRQQHGGIVGASSSSKKQAGAELFTTTHQADRSVALTDSNDATKRSNWFDKDEGDMGKKEGAVVAKIGPSKAATNVRMTTMMDFAPDVCKDYKKTGWCGFGDNCKYLHDRSDYKSGWQLDKDWENVTKGKKNLGGTVVASANAKKSGRTEDDDDEEDSDEDGAMLENIPFACIICEKPYKAPIVTRCGHYFCESCALKRYRKDPSCAACGAGTNGVFNTAGRLKKLLERKRERAARKRREAIEAGEEVSDDDEEEEGDED